MAAINLYEWEGNYVLSGTVTPAIPEDATLTLKVSTSDNRVFFDCIDEDCVDEAGGTTITKTIPQGSTQFQIGLGLADTTTQEGDLNLTVEIVSFVIGSGGSNYRIIIQDGVLVATVVDDEVPVQVKFEQSTSTASNSNPPNIKVLLVDTITGQPRQTSVDTNVNLRVQSGVPSTGNFGSVPTSITIPAYETEGFVTFNVSSACTDGAEVDVELEVTPLDGCCVNSFDSHTVTLQGTGQTIIASLDPANESYNEWQGTTKTFTGSFTSPIPGQATIVFKDPVDPRVIINNGSDLVVPVGTTSFSFPIQVVDDLNQIDTSEVVSIDQIQATLFYPEIDTNSNQITINITDDDIQATLTVQSAFNGQTITSNDGNIKITASLDRLVSTQVDLQAFGTGTAVAGRDYEFVDSTVSINSYESSVDVFLNVLDGAFPGVTLTVDLGILAGNAIDGQVNSISFTLSGTGNPIEVSFDSPTVSGNEIDEPVFSAILNFDSALPEEALVDLVFAQPSTRFVNVIDYIVPAGSNSVVIEYQVVDDAGATRQDTVDTLEIRSFESYATVPTFTPQIGSASTFEMTVVDDEHPVQLSFTQQAITANGGDTVNLTVSSNRTHSEDIQINLAYTGATGDITGQTATTTLTAGTTSKTFAAFTVNGSPAGNDVTVRGSVNDALQGAFAAGKDVVLVDIQGVTITSHDLNLTYELHQVYEGDAPTIEFSGTITPAIVTSGTLDFNYLSSNGTTYDPATDAGFTLDPISLDLTAGQTSFVFSATVTNDSTDQGDRTYYANVSAFDVSDGIGNILITAADRPEVQITEDDVSATLTLTTDVNNVVVTDLVDADVVMTFELDQAVNQDVTVSLVYEPNVVIATPPTGPASITIPQGTVGPVTGTLNIPAGSDITQVLIVTTVTAGGARVTNGACSPENLPIAVTYIAGNGVGVGNLIDYERADIQNTNELIQVTVPIDPVDLTSLPRFAIDGVPADVFPVSYTHDDKVDVVQVAGMTTSGYDYSYGATTFQSLPGSAILQLATDVPTVTLNEVDLAALRLNLYTRNPDGSLRIWSTPTFNGWSLKETIRDGSYISEKRYFAQFANGADKLLGVTAFVTQRYDHDVAEVSFIISNDIYDPVIDARDPNSHIEVNGDVYFYGIKMQLPAGYVMYEGSNFVGGEVITSDPSINNQNAWLVEPVNQSNLNATPGQGSLQSNPNAFYLQCIPRRKRLVRRLCIAPLNTPSTDYRVLCSNINGMKGYGTSRTLEYDGSGKPLGYSYYAKRGYGSQRSYLVEPNDYFTWNSASGFEAVKERASEYLGRVRSSFNSIDGTNIDVDNTGMWLFNQGFFAGQNDPKTRGWWRPWGTKFGGEYGGDYINLRFGIENVSELWSAASIIAQYTAQRQANGLISPDGDIVSVEDLLDQNGKLPFKETDYIIGQPSRGWPYFQKIRKNDQFVENIDAGNSNPPLAPLTREWNTPGSAPHVLYNETAGGDGWQIFGNHQVVGSNSYWEPIDSDHFVRIYSILQSLVWGCNLGLAKFLSKEHGEFVRRTISDREVDSTSFQHSSGAYNPNHYGVREYDILNVISFPYPNLGGKYQNNSNSIPDQLFQVNRGEGHLLTAASEAYRITKPSDRQAMSSWASIVMEAIGKLMGPGGSLLNNDGAGGWVNWTPPSWPSSRDYKDVFFYSGCDTFSGIQDLLDLPSADLSAEALLRRGNIFNSSYPDSSLLGAHQHYQQTYADWGLVGLAESVFGIDPSNINTEIKPLLNAVAYQTYRLWQWLDSIREAKGGNSYTFDDARKYYESYTHKFANAVIMGRENSVLETPQDMIAWDFESGFSPLPSNTLWDGRDAYDLYLSYKLTGEQKFLDWARVMLMRPYINNTITVDGGGNLVGGDEVTNDTVPSSIPNAVNLYNALWSKNTGERLSENITTYGLHDAVSEMIHMDYNLTYDPKSPFDYNNQTYAGQTNCGTGGGNPGGSRYTNNIIADWLFSGTKDSNFASLDDSINGLTLLDYIDGATYREDLDGRSYLEIPRDKALYLASDADNDFIVSELSGTDAFTIELWVRSNNNVFGGPSRIINIGPTEQTVSNDGPGYDKNVAICQGGNTDAQAQAGRLQIRVKHSGTGAAFQTEDYGGAGDPIGNNTLEHIVMTFEPSAIRAYVNRYDSADNRSTQTESFNSTPVIEDINTNFNLDRWVASPWKMSLGGDFPDLNSSNNITRAFDGDFYRVAIYKEALVPSSIEQNYEVGPYGDATVNLNVRWGSNSDAVFENGGADLAQFTHYIPGELSFAAPSPGTVTVSADNADPRVSLSPNPYTVDISSGDTAFEVPVIVVSGDGYTGNINTTFRITNTTVPTGVATAQTYILTVNDTQIPGGGGGNSGGGGGTGTGGSNACVSQNPSWGWFDSVTTDEGITWYFDQPYKVGRFVGGEYWVAPAVAGGTITVTAIDPAPEYNNDYGGYINGSMIDPSSVSGIGESIGWIPIDCNTGEEVDLSTYTNCYDNVLTDPAYNKWGQGFLGADGLSLNEGINFTGWYRHYLNVGYPDPTQPNTPVGQNGVVLTIDPLDSANGIKSLVSSKSGWALPHNEIADPSDTYKLREDSTGLTFDVPRTLQPRFIPEYLKANDPTWPYGKDANIVQGSKTTNTELYEVLTILSSVPDGYVDPPGGGGGTGGGTGNGAGYADLLLPGRFATWINRDSAGGIDLAQRVADYGVDVWLNDNFKLNRYATDGSQMPSFPGNYNALVSNLLSKGITPVPQFNPWGTGWWNNEFGFALNVDSFAGTFGKNQWPPTPETEDDLKWVMLFHEHDLANKTYTDALATNRGWFDIDGDPSKGKAIRAQDVVALAELFKQNHPDVKVYVYHSKAIAIAGANLTGGENARPYNPNTGYGIGTTWADYYKHIAESEFIDGHLFDYYPWNTAIRQGAQFGSVPDPADQVDTIPPGGGIIVDDPKWNVKAVERLKEWSKTPEYPNGKPVYMTICTGWNNMIREDYSLTATHAADYPVKSDDVNLEYMGSRPHHDGYGAGKTQEQLDMITSALDLGMDGVVFYGYCHYKAYRRKGCSPSTGCGTGEGNCVLDPENGQYECDGTNVFWRDLGAAWDGGTGTAVVNDWLARPELHKSYIEHLDYFREDYDPVDAGGVATFDAAVGDGSVQFAEAIVDHINNYFASQPLPGSNPAVLDIPCEGYFRPAHTGLSSEKVLWHTSSIDWTMLNNLPIVYNQTQNINGVQVPVIPTDLSSFYIGPHNPSTDYIYDGRWSYEYPAGTGFKQMKRPIKRPFSMFHNFGGPRQSDQSEHHAWRNGDRYGDTLLSYSGRGFALINFDYPQEEKKLVLYPLLQMSIDLDSIYNSGRIWYAEQGHMHGRLLHILYKRALLDKNFDNFDPWKFSDCSQNYTIPEGAAGIDWINIANSGGPDQTGTYFISTNLDSTGGSTPGAGYNHHLKIGGEDGYPGTDNRGCQKSHKPSPPLPLSAVGTRHYNGHGYPSVHGQECELRFAGADPQDIPYAFTVHRNYHLDALGIMAPKNFDLNGTSTNLPEQLALKGRGDFVDVLDRMILTFFNSNPIYPNNFSLPGITSNNVRWKQSGSGAQFKFQNQSYLGNYIYYRCTSEFQARQPVKPFTAHENNQLLNNRVQLGGGIQEQIGVDSNGDPIYQDLDPLVASKLDVFQAYQGGTSFTPSSFDEITTLYRQSTPIDISNRC